MPQAGSLPETGRARAVAAEFVLSHRIAGPAELRAMDEAARSCLAGAVGEVRNLLLLVIGLVAARFAEGGGADLLEEVVSASVTEPPLGDSLLLTLVLRAALALARPEPVRGLATPSLLAGTFSPQERAATLVRVGVADAWAGDFVPGRARSARGPRAGPARGGCRAGGRGHRAPRQGGGLPRRPGVGPTPPGAGPSARRGRRVGVGRRRPPGMQRARTPARGRRRLDGRPGGPRAGERGLALGAGRGVPARAGRRARPPWTPRPGPRASRRPAEDADAVAGPCSGRALAAVRPAPRRRRLGRRPGAGGADPEQALGADHGGRATWLVGERHAAAGRRSDAVRCLQWSAARYASVGALGPLRCVESALSDLLPGSPPLPLAPSSSPDLRVLTEAERRVVIGVRAGLSNKEIAAALFVSVRTVESHLGAAFRKLGVRSRTQLALLG